MKLAMFVLAGLLGAASLASADDLPGNDQGGDYYGPPGATQDAPSPPPPRRAQRGARGNGELRQALLQRFDRDGDGRLEPRERRQAARALRRMAKRMSQQGGGDRMAMRRQRLIERFDTNGDGNLGPGELPPRLQRKLRRMDRNGDGWVDQRDR
jgi:hypothetical protein